MEDPTSLKLVFFNRSPLAGMPWRTMKVCDKYLRAHGEGWARSIVDKAAYGNGISFPHDLLASDIEAAIVMKDADLVIFSSYGKPGNGLLAKKPWARHYSTEHFRWVEKTPDPAYSTVVAQYQHRFAPHLDVLPNCIPIEDWRFMPGDKPKDRVMIVYTPSNRKPRGGKNPWASKGYSETIEQLRKLSVQFKDRVEVLVLENRPNEEVLRAKRHAHVVIDECVTGSYHSSGLEGLSCGAVTLAHIDGDTLVAQRKLWPDSDLLLPFLSTTVFHLKATLETLVGNPDLLTMMGEANREWMSTNYSEEWQATRWVNWHQKCLNSFAARSSKP